MVLWIFDEWLESLYDEIKRPIKVYAEGKWAKNTIAWLEYLGDSKTRNPRWQFNIVKTQEEADFYYETNEEKIYWDFLNEKIPEKPSEISIAIEVKEIKLIDEVIDILLKVYKKSEEYFIANSSGDIKERHEKYLEEMNRDSFGGRDIGVRGLYPETPDGLMLLYKDLFSDYLRLAGVHEATKDFLVFEKARISEHPRVSSYIDGLQKKQWDAVIAAILHDMKK